MIGLNFQQFYSKIFFVLAKQSRALGAFKLARFALEQLSYLKIPTRLESMIETASILIRATPFTDAEQLLLMCYKSINLNFFSLLFNFLFFWTH